ncbi:DUF3472 domain-containing protein [Neolewinella persica]|uniref:DUF3472 domain-containing protein n=1 Tax=Neolewinella persica TaxID=70998 RepID=UPI000476FF02|nr:DUF3472 domain-containing protein [Neolewinella persica]
MKQSNLLLAFVFIALLSSCSSFLNEIMESTPPSPSNLDIAVPTTGNSWVMKNGSFTSSELITEEGVLNWTNPNHTIRTFFYVENAGKVSLGVRAKVASGTSKIRVSYQNKSQDITLNGSSANETYIGDFQADKPGYYFVDITGLEKSGPVYADVSDVLLGGVNIRETKYIKDDFYFGRRGPSVHLNFELPDGVSEVEWFYSELNIPKNQDVIGSYFMANGFGEGYFGIQVNSPTERKILFSVWSPYQTDNPVDIPEDYKIKLLKKGNGVTTGEFGNEGSGGQSYKVFNWKTGVNYGFLVGATPSSDGSTDYVAYFHNPELNKWDLIAQFRRPKTTTYLKHLYSFLENFIPEQGVLARKGLYKNQWAYAANGWHELTRITFTADNTARKDYRLDYSGGTENDGFYLKNCGFTNDDKVLINAKFERPELGVPPRIDFRLLD